VLCCEPVSALAVRQPSRRGVENGVPGGETRLCGGSLRNTSGPRPNTRLHSVIPRFRANGCTCRGRMSLIVCIRVPIGTTDKPVIFNFHGYPALIHKLAYRRANDDNMHVYGYREKGGIDTPLGLTIQNQVDRFSVPIGDGGNSSPSGEARSSKVPEGTRYPPTESQRFGAGEEWKVKSALG
jgi:hypothetical protein